MTVFETSGSLNPEEQSDIIVQRLELKEIIEHIKNQDEYIVIQAPTQSGKTTLLYQIHFLLHQHGYGVVYLDLSLLCDLAPNEFYPMFCTEIQERLTDLTFDNKDTTLPPDKVTNQISFVKYLRLLSEKTQQIRKLVFMIDEIGSLPEKIALTLFPSVRHIFNRGRNPSIPSNDRDFYKKIMFIFAGSLDLDKLIQGQNSPLRNICQPFTLDDFSLEQVNSLAKNLTDFSPEIIEFIADCVHQWGDGHPYLTQRLLALIDENQEYRSAINDSLPDAIDQLVKEYIFKSDDANLAHIFHYLRKNGDSYCQAVSQILRSQPEERKETAPHAKELSLMGIIKRSSDLRLIIRNKFYEEALKIFFEQESRNRGRT